MSLHHNAELQALHDTLEELWERNKTNRLQAFVPYPKQQRFFDLGLTKRERLLIAGNQLGKTEAGAVEAAYHLTGLYPDGWLGRRFANPVRMWAAGETSLLVRDVQQKKLFGSPGVKEEFGTGYIPKDTILDTSLARGVTDAYDTVQVRHVSGGISTITFKSYEQGRTKFQGEPVDFIWGDEEPPIDIYTEMLTRTNATKGSVIITFTPLLGMSDVVKRFLQEEDPDRATVTMTIYDALHYTDEDRARIIKSYPAHEREARTQGVPMLGSGRIFVYSDEAVAEPPLDYLPQHWPKLWGIDFGISHPFGAALIAWDKDADVVHLIHALKFEGQLPINHAAAMKAIGAQVPVAWPQDGTAREKTSGKPLSDSYKQQGLLMLPEHATWPTGGVSTEAGILEMDQRFSTGRLKVAAHLSAWFEEFRMYHRKDGIIVKVNDDLLSATRIALMMKRHARLVPLGGPRGIGVRRQTVARDVDFPLF